MESVPSRKIKTHFARRTGAAVETEVNNIAVEFLDLVEADLRHARNFYESWKFDGAEDFYGKFQETISWIGWNPELFPRKYKRFRRAIIRHTYFAIFYAIEIDAVVVVAVLDMRRDPRVIKSMLRTRINR
jgi:plasmid stabilization system protein ParE